MIDPCLQTILPVARLGDWRVTVGDVDASSYASMRNFSTGSVVLGDGATSCYHIEDQNDNAPLPAFLGPKQGGRPYDAEFLGVVGYRLNRSRLYRVADVGEMG